VNPQERLRASGKCTSKHPWIAIGRYHRRRDDQPNEYCAKCPSIARFYDFASLEELYGSRFCKSLACAWERRFGNDTIERLEITKHAYYAVIKFLSFVAARGVTSPNATLGKVFTIFKGSKSSEVPRDLLLNAIFLFRQEVENGFENRRTIKSKNSFIGSLARALRALSDARFIPACGDIKGFKRPATELNSRPTLIQLGKLMLA
jgi:hypothetical protein